MTRKRKRASEAGHVKDKRPHHEVTTAGDRLHPTRGLLQQYYKQVCTLRQYLVCSLPETSKRRRRRLLNYGLSGSGSVSDGVQAEVGLLDSTLVGSFNPVPVNQLEALDKDILAFTQELTQSTIGSTPKPGALTQSEVGGLLGFPYPNLECFHCFVDTRRNVR